MKKKRKRNEKETKKKRKRNEKETKKKRKRNEKETKEEMQEMKEINKTCERVTNQGCSDKGI
jgi:hypothetical protein